MKKFEFYIKDQQQTIRKLVIKNNSNTAKLFKILKYDEVLKLLVVQGNSVKEITIEKDATNISVAEVMD